MEYEKRLKFIYKLFIGLGTLFMILFFVLFMVIRGQVTDYNIISLIMPMFNGSIFLITGFILNCINNKRIKEIEYLMENGVILHARVDRVDIGFKKFMKTKNRIITCIYQEGGQNHIFKSEDIFRQVENVLHKGDIINVYVDPDNYKKYYVDVE